MFSCNEFLSHIWQTRIFPKIYQNDEDEHEQPNFGALSPDEMTFYLLFWFDCECLNGGMRQFISNSSGDFFYETQDAFRRVGALGSSKWLDAVERLFGQPLPKNRWERNELFQVVPDETVDQMESIEGEFVDIEEEEKCVLAFARRHFGETA